MMYEKKTVSVGRFILTERGKEVRLPHFTSSAMHSTYSRAPYAFQTLAARRASAVYAASFLFGTGTTKPSTYRGMRISPLLGHLERDLRGLLSIDVHVNAVIALGPALVRAGHGVIDARHVLEDGHLLRINRVVRRRDGRLHGDPLPLHLRANGNVDDVGADEQLRRGGFKRARRLAVLRIRKNDVRVSWRACHAFARIQGRDGADRRDRGPVHFGTTSVCATMSPSRCFFLEVQ